MFKLQIDLDIGGGIIVGGICIDGANLTVPSRA
jgi:hypothetical protein